MGRCNGYKIMVECSCGKCDVIKEKKEVNHFLIVTRGGDDGFYNNGAMRAASMIGSGNTNVLVLRDFLKAVQAVYDRECASLPGEVRDLLGALNKIEDSAVVTTTLLNLKKEGGED